MSRLTIDVTEQQHQVLKAMAALEGKTIKQYALERLFPASAGEGQAAASKLQQLRSLIDEGEASGDLVTWNVDTFLSRMKKAPHAD